MKLESLKITLKNDSTLSFTIEKEDWEIAPSPICMDLVSPESWKKVADELSISLNDFKYNDEDNITDFFWSEYERLVLKNCKCFYYEDMTDDEYAEYINEIDETKSIAILEKAYTRIKANN